MQKRRYFLCFILITGLVGGACTLPVLVGQEATPSPSGGSTPEATTEAITQASQPNQPVSTQWTTGGTVYYVRPDGGSITQCDGKSDKPSPGHGSGQACAWDHPFRALPPGGPAHIAGGDTLIIGAGSYRMGIGAPETDATCDAAYPWDCVMAPVPGGPDPSHPTHILGAGWQNGCQSAPELWGTQRANFILNLEGSNNVEIACLEITDHSSCVEGHPDPGLTCQRDHAPYGDWAAVGIWAVDSDHVTISKLNIHGLSNAGVHAGRISNWTVENVRLAANGMAGWDGDVGSDSRNSGELIFQHWLVEWNGCAETYPGKKPTGCWAQQSGGYGDGVGTGETGGQWVIEDSAFLHNTSDGLDLLYARIPGSKIEVRRVLAEGNSGNQIKTNGPVTIENSVIVGNCAYFKDFPNMTEGDQCRALGNALSISLQPGDQAVVTNNTITGQGDCLVIAGCEGTCRGDEVVRMRNNIFLARAEFLQTDEQTCLAWPEGFPKNPFDIDYSIVLGAKDTPPCPGPHDLCGVDPGLVNESLEAFDAHLQPGSPAINAATTNGTPLTDFDARPRDAQPDIGAYEWR